MKPGRELDAFVAEKLMEMTGVSLYYENYAKPNDTGTAFERTELPHFSTDISAAWLVVEKLGIGTWKTPGKCFLFNLDYCPDAQGGWDYQADFYDDIGEIYHHKAKSYTAAHAICLAALKTIGIKNV